jgi:hypothetical protein
MLYVFVFSRIVLFVMLKACLRKPEVCLYGTKFIIFRFHHLKLLHLLLFVVSFQLVTNKSKIKHVIQYVGKN